MSMNEYKANADLLGEDYVREVITLPASRKVTATMAPAGGYLLKITRCAK